MANAGQSRFTSSVLWLLGLTAIVLIVFGVRRLTHEEVLVTVAPVTYQTLSSTVATNGKVEPIADFQAHAPFAGAIKQIYVQVGQHVSKGTLLVRMDDSDARGRLASAQGVLANAQLIQRDLAAGGSTEDLSRFKTDTTSAVLEQQRAATDLATNQALLQKGATSQAEVAAAQQRLDSANLVLENARSHSGARYNSGDQQNAKARVADAQAAVASAESNLNNVDIRSPIDGSVYNIPVTQFDFVQFGDNILDVADLKHLQVSAFFDEPEIGKLARGQAVKIVWEAKQGRVWHGHVSLAPTTVQGYVTRSVGVCLITVDDPTPDLIPHTNVTVTVTESERPHALTIPREAMHTEGALTFVYRIVDGHLAQTPINPGIVSMTAVEVLSGLTPNDIVVLGPKSSNIELSSGLEVKQAK